MANRSEQNPGVNSQGPNGTPRTDTAFGRRLGCRTTMPLTLEVSVSTLSVLDMVRVHAGTSWHGVPWAGRVLPHTVEGVLMTCSDLRQPLRRVPSFIDWNCVVRRLTCGMPSRDNAVQPRRGADAPAGVEARDWKPTRPWKRRVAENALAGEERDGPRWPCALGYGAGV